VLGLEDYLLATWHPDTRPMSLNLAEEAGMRWLGLKVLAAREEGDAGSVHFIARYKMRGRAGFIDENSRFKRENGYWFYVDGVIE